MAKKGKKKAANEKLKAKVAKKAAKRLAKDKKKAEAPAVPVAAAEPEIEAAAPVAAPEPVTEAAPAVSSFPEAREDEQWKAVSLKMPVSHIAVVDEAAKAYGESGVSRSEFIRMALDTFIAQQR